MSKDNEPGRREPPTKATRKPKFPPSLSNVGRSVSAVEGDDRRHRLEQIMHGLPLRDGAAPRIAIFARDLWDMFLLATHVMGARRKTRSAGATSVQRQLRYIESGSNTLLKRLRNAPENVFRAWVEAADIEDYIDHHEITYEWLQLQRLLETAAERAKRASKTGFPKADPKSRGRPPHDTAAAVTAVAVNAYEELTGRDAVRSIDRHTQKPCGKFHEFLAALFDALAIKSNPDAANKQFQSDRYLQIPEKK
jgi:hypothetical protein